MMYPEIEPVLSAVERLRAIHTPVMVAMDGRSGTGKSTLAQAIAEACEGVYIDQDDFYSGGDFVDWEPLCPRERAYRCIDWRRVRSDVLKPLIAGEAASWHPFDWDTLRGLSAELIHVESTDVVVLDGAYSARHELADLLDLTVLVTLPEDIRRQRLVHREGEDWMSSWHRVWDEAEDYYFGKPRTPDTFDIVVDRTPGGVRGSSRA